MGCSPKKQLPKSLSKRQKPLFSARRNAGLYCPKAGTGAGTGSRNHQSPAQRNLERSGWFFWVLWMHWRCWGIKSLVGRSTKLVERTKLYPHAWPRQSLIKRRLWSHDWWLWWTTCDFIDLQRSLVLFLVLGLWFAAHQKIVRLSVWWN